MNVEMNGWKWILGVISACDFTVCAQTGSTIVLGPIEGELAKKQIALDLDGTQKSLLSLASRAINARCIQAVPPIQAALGFRLWPWGVKRFNSPSLRGIPVK